MIPAGITFDKEYYIVEVNITLGPEVFDWLNETFGEQSSGRWTYRFPTLYFANDRDRTMFVLRWS